jgi:ribosomal protein S18 acetylase RimI-like enzyme
VRQVSQDVQVRPLEPHDLVGMAQSMAIDAEAFPHPSIVIGQPTRRPTLVAWAGSPKHVVGFLASARSSVGAYVQGVAVASGARRRGVARALVRACIAQATAQGLCSLSLHVGIVNRAAFALYDAEGFLVGRVVRGFYRPGVYAVPDAYLMVLQLRPGDHLSSE